MFNGKLRIGVVFDRVIYEYSELVISGIRSACKNNDVEFLIFSMGELNDIHSSYAYQNVSVTSLISNKNLDGAIFVSAAQMHYSTKNEVMSYIKSFLPLPIVNISTQIPGIPSITVECYNAYEAILTDLVKNQDCKKFGIVGVRNFSNEAKNRRNNIRDILKKLGIPSENITYWKADFDYSVTMTELEEYYNAKKSFDFDCILCLNDVMAYAALDFCAKYDLKVPEDIAVVGFDDLERSAYCSTPLTSFDQQISEQGYQAAQLLFDLLNGKTVPEHTTIEAKVVIRQSSCKKGYSKDLERSPYSQIGFRNNFFSSKYSGTEWYNKKDQFYRLTQFYTELQDDMTSQQLRHRLNEDMQALNISGCAIVLYENPIETSAPFDYFNLPHKAVVYTAFDKLTGYDSNNEETPRPFNPNQTMLPEGVLKFTEDGTVIFALYHNSLQYGYLLLRLGDYDTMIYDMLVKILSTIIASVHSFSLIHEESTQYQSESNKLGVIASTDELTGLHNRRGLYELGEATLSLDEKLEHSGMIIYCDMDNLKKINDTMGHEAGDRAIMAESIILKGNFRSNDIIARLGGDEFAIICSGLTKEAYKRIKQQIEEDCDAWSVANNSTIPLSISMGCVSYPSYRFGYKISSLLAQADSLMYREKRTKKAERE